VPGPVDDYGDGEAVSEMPDGSVRGMRVRGGYELDMDWKEGRLAKAILRDIE
jgi:hypothetical protein